MDPVIEEFGRVREPGDIRLSKLRDWQQYMKHVIQPKLDELATMQAAQTNGQGKKRPEVTA
jgi:hypothetical protein